MLKNTVTITAIIFISCYQMDKNDFYKLLGTFNRFEGKVDSLTNESFANVFQSKEAKENKEIIYFFLTKKPIARLHGASPILYIGQTKNSLSTRYSNNIINIITMSKANRIKYGCVINEYGPIEIAHCHYREFGETLKQAEGQFLWWYFQNHFEYPPFNYTQTSTRSDGMIYKIPN